jgi:hypothetical protein
VTNPAAKTKSIGLPAIAQLSWFLQRHIDHFIVTGQLRSIYRDYSVKTVSSGRENSRPSTGTFAKTHASPDTDGNFPYHRAVIANVQYQRQIASAMTTCLDTATAYLAHLLLRDTRPIAHAKAKEPNALALF